MSDPRFAEVNGRFAVLEASLTKRFLTMLLAGYAALAGLVLAAAQFV